MDGVSIDFICGDDAPAQALRVLVSLRRCCLGASVYGPHRCTCWEPEFDLQQCPVIEGEPGQRETMCVDCAYRPNSPERSGDERYSHADEQELLNLTEPFWCHQGMRKPVRWRHPAGITVDADTDAYRPPIVNNVPYKSDGTPGDRCAGWLAHRKRDADDLKAMLSDA